MLPSTAPLTTCFAAPGKPRPSAGHKPTRTRAVRPPGCARLREFVAGVVADERLAGVHPLAVQLGQRALHIAPHDADSDPEDALAALEQLHDLVGRGALVDRRAVAHQGHLREIVQPAEPQMLDRGTDVLQGHAGVQQPLDDLQDDDIPEAVEPLLPDPYAGRTLGSTSPVRAQ